LKMKVPQTLPQQLDKDAAFSTLVENVADALSVTQREARRTVIYGWADIGEQVKQYVETYNLNNINTFCATLAQEVGKNVGRSISRRSIYYAVAFVDRLEQDNKTVEDAIGEYESWTRITKLYLTEGGGCTNTQDSATESNNMGSVYPLSDPSPPSPPLSSYDEYLVKPCPICGGGPCEKAHWPTTVRAGAADDEWIPLCHECHMEQHKIGFISWFDMYGRKLFKEFIYPIIRGKKP